MCVCVHVPGELGLTVLLFGSMRGECHNVWAQISEVEELHGSDSGSCALRTCVFVEARRNHSQRLKEYNELQLF